MVVISRTAGLRHYFRLPIVSKSPVDRLYVRSKHAVMCIWSEAEKASSQLEIVDQSLFFVAENLQIGIYFSFPLKSNFFLLSYMTTLITLEVISTIGIHRCWYQGEIISLFRRRTTSSSRSPRNHSLAQWGCYYSVR